MRLESKERDREDLNLYYVNNYNKESVFNSF